MARGSKRAHSLARSLDRSLRRIQNSTELFATRSRVDHSLFFFSSLFHNAIGGQTPPLSERHSASSGAAAAAATGSYSESQTYFCWHTHTAVTHSFSLSSSSFVRLFTQRPVISGWSYMHAYWRCTYVASWSKHQPTNQPNERPDGKRETRSARKGTSSFGHKSQAEKRRDRSLSEVNR